MKKLLSLALGLSLATPVFNINALTSEEATKLRQTAAVVSSVSSVLVAADGATNNADLEKISSLSTLVYSLLASAQEDGDLYMKLTRIIQEAGKKKDNGLATFDKWNSSNTRKDVLFAALQQALKEAGHSGFDALEAKLAKIDNHFAKRVVRAISYALTDAVVTNYFKEIKVGFWKEYFESLIQNLCYEAFGELIAQEIIKN